MAQNDMYKQGRNGNGQFNNRKVQNGSKNPLLYYPAGEARKITGASGNSVSTKMFNSLVNKAGAKGSRRLNY